MFEEGAGEPVPERVHPGVPILTHLLAAVGGILIGWSMRDRRGS
jgi:hypothetical protein